jgi:hypothetical protein
VAGKEASVVEAGQACSKPHGTVIGTASEPGSGVLLTPATSNAADGFVATDLSTANAIANAATNATVNAVAHVIAAAAIDAITAAAPNGSVAAGCLRAAADITLVLRRCPIIITVDDVAIRTHAYDATTGRSIVRLING